MTWQALEDEIRRRGDAGRPVEFWWRDDDATACSDALERLLKLSRSHRVPLALAVIPQEATPQLFGVLHERVSVLQHGTDHRNRAAAGEKKTEYPGTESVESALARIAEGMAKLRSRAGQEFMPVLAPPWNRMRADLVDKLPSLGIRGVSAYGPQKSREPAPGLRQVNTHVDVVAWRRGRRFVGEAEALTLALKNLSSEQPLGWLTHHAVHDEATWDFLERLFTLKEVRWLSAAEAFSYTAPAHG
ncbi:MAG TPA: polysaccharide deacetylase family protein [Burkholderiales bacterium]|nr:polysaccharide deacetylase family protein [Burkholderiales bacterium]